MKHFLKKGMLVFSLMSFVAWGGINEAQAILITHVPDDRVPPPPVVVSPANGTLAPGGTLGANYIDYGVDYTFGGVEGIFADGAALAFGGVNGLGKLDLISPVDGRIVLPGTLLQGLTSFLKVEAGFSAVGTLLLEVFDIGGTLLGSADNSFPSGPHGRTTLTIDRAGIFDIASFKVSGNSDNWGADQVWLETPIGQTPVPEPSTMLLLGSGLVGLIGYRMKKARG